MLGTLLLVIHIVIAVLICIVILMQSAKGEGLSGAFGLGQGTTSFFGADTANVLVRITTVLAVLFMLTSLSLAYIQAQRARSVTRTPRGPGESSMTAPPTEEEEADKESVEQPSEGEAPEADEPTDAGAPTDVGEDEAITEPEGGEATEEATPGDDDVEPGEGVQPGEDEPGPDEPVDPPSTES